ncbi:MAG: TIGR03960 family B12-binding radical SAM protein [Syntrophomonadaceae bacterium]|jgi:radical SAM family uncharacterized protein|nr:TIGR03960 family B12-binding radical SAM protein [Syntrophomonadaceae bacterium]
MEGLSILQHKLIRDVLPRVSKPARYAGGELNMIKKSWDSSGVKMLLAFPDVYEVGMSHVGSKILYGLVNEKSHHLLERCYAPWPDMEAIMREEGIPLYSLESFTPMEQFDLVGFSLEYELSLTNVLNMLDLGYIPVLAKDRQAQDPIVIGGGPVCTNPEPFADFFDALVIGDGEEVLLEILDLLGGCQGLARLDILRRLARLEGVYVPSLYEVQYDSYGRFASIKPLEQGVPEKIRRRVVKSLDKAYFPQKPVVPYMPVVHDRAVLEVMRGCQRGCRFCQAGMIYRPVRERRLNTLLQQAEAQIRSTGYDEVSLVSLSTLDFSQVNPLVAELVRRYSLEGIGVALPSLRVDKFSVDLANEVQKVRKSTLTLAPEAGTQRLRDVINKNVTEEQLMEAVAAAFRSGWTALKLYFMIGLPQESYEDLDGILDLLIKVKACGDELAPRRVEVRASLACFVPKAHTPFQWRPQDSIEELKEKRRYLSRRRLRGIKLSFHDEETSFLEGAIARGDRRMARVIHKAWQKGCRFDGWSEHFRFAAWQEAFAECGVDPGLYVTRGFDYGEGLPWDVIDTGIDREFLIQEDELARLGMSSGDCRYEGCNNCGVCPSLEVDLDIGEDSDALAGGI